MLAAVNTKYGDLDNLQFREVATPNPAEGQVRVRIRAVGLNDFDYGLITGKPLFTRLFFGLRRPKNPIPGCDIAGEVDAVGPGASRFQPGDRVFGDLSGGRFGGYAQYVCCAESELESMAPGMRFVDAAALPQAGTLAWQAIQCGSASDGLEVLINGAGGGVGILGVQLLKHHHAARVTGVDAASKLQAMRDAGFDAVLDYRETDFTRTGVHYDLIIDTKTTRWPGAYLRALKRGGCYVTVGGSMPKCFLLAVLGLLKRPLKGKRLILVAQKPNYGLAMFRDLAAEGTLKPLIDGPYPFSELHHRLSYFLRAEHRGKVVLTMD